MADLLKIGYAQTGQSAATNAFGMREMQARATKNSAPTAAGRFIIRGFTWNETPRYSTRKSCAAKTQKP